MPRMLFEVSERYKDDESLVSSVLFTNVRAARKYARDLAHESYALIHRQWVGAVREPYVEVHDATLPEGSKAGLGACYQIGRAAPSSEPDIGIHITRVMAYSSASEVKRMR